MHQSLDKDLLQTYRETGEQKIIGILYTRYSHLVYGLCLKYFKDREMAQDATMAVFEKLIEKLKTEEVEYFKSWLYMVTKNHCLMALRKKNPEMKSDFMEMTLVAHPNEEKIELENDLNALEECIGGLKKQQEQCVKLFFIEKKSYQQVCEQTEHDLKAVKSLIQNGKRNLKICLESKNVSR